VTQSPWEELDAEREEMIARANRYADLGLGVHAELLRAGGRLPPSVQSAPMIVDTDVGGDPDDAVALVVAATAVPSLALVLTSDELDGERARLARYLLDLAGRPDVPVVAGQRAVQPPLFSANGLVPAAVPAQPDDVVAAVDATCAGTGPVRWVGMGPMSNLAGVLAARPDLAPRIVLTQMGGAVRYRDPRRAEHNVRLDPAGARKALSRVPGPALVTSDVTFHAAMELGPDSPAYRQLAHSRAESWAPVLRAHLDRWFAKHHPSSMQHDALTLSAALQLPFVDFAQRRITFDEIGRMNVVSEPRGITPDDLEPGVPGLTVVAFVSRRAHYGAFWAWLTRHLAP
jgi:pyrimidine-specific ribonucleoside hydrolase